jgi:4-hydroxybenzoate polyprenyltransferase
MRSRAVAMPPTRAASSHRGVPAALLALRIIHPFPTVLNVAATAALACVAIRGLPDRDRFAAMLLVMLLVQSAIGVTNDLFDQDLDARTKPWKPIVAGLVSPAAAAIVAGTLAVAALAIASTLAPASFGLALLGTASGLAYDVRLKRTMLSAVPYMIGIPVLPIWVWITVGKWDASLGWLLPLGALIGLALHLANTLPDLDADVAAGVGGLAHRLGARASIVVAWTSFGAALALSAAIAPWVGYDLRMYAAAVAFGVLCLVGSIAVYALRRDEFALRVGFGALGVGAAVLATGWLAAVR